MININVHPKASDEAKIFHDYLLDNQTLEKDKEVKDFSNIIEEPHKYFKGKIPINMVRLVSKPNMSTVSFAPFSGIDVQYKDELDHRQNYNRLRNRIIRHALDLLQNHKNVNNIRPLHYLFNRFLLHTNNSIPEAFAPFRYKDAPDSILEEALNTYIENPKVINDAYNKIKNYMNIMKVQRMSLRYLPNYNKLTYLST